MTTFCGWGGTIFKHRDYAHRSAAAHFIDESEVTDVNFEEGTLTYAYTYINEKGQAKTTEYTVTFDPDNYDADNIEEALENIGGLSEDDKLRFAEDILVSMGVEEPTKEQVEEMYDVLFV